MASGGDESDPSLDPAQEALRLVGAARALVAEFSEEGVSEFERAALPAPQPLPSRTPQPPDVARPASHPTTIATPPPRPATPAKRGGTVQPAPSAAPSAPPARSVPSAPSALLGVAEAVPWAGRRPSLEEVRAHLGDCERCGLHRERHSIVFGDGNPNADLMFIGEGPGEQEDRQGLPFVGRAGDLLTQMIEKGIGMSRSDVYICNIVKCRPPQNRNPLPPEVSACRPFLDGQIEAIAPRVIVTLGKPAASLLLNREVAITRVRGTWHEYRGIPLMPTLHPAYVLRQYTAENRRAVWQDLQAAAERSRS